MTTREAHVIDIVDSLQNLSSPGRKHMLKFVYSKIVLEKSLNEAEVYATRECFSFVPHLAVFDPQVVFLISFAGGSGKRGT